MVSPFYQAPMGSSQLRSSCKRAKQLSSSSSSSSHRTQEPNRLETIRNTKTLSRRLKKRFCMQKGGELITGDSPNMEGSHRMNIKFLLNEDEQADSSERPASNPSVMDGAEARRARSVEASSGSRYSRRETVTRYRCSCSWTSPTVDELVRHRKEKHNNKSMFCPYCSSVYSRYDSVRNHVEEKHKKPGEFWCHKCNFKTSSRQSFDKHMAREHHVCSKCGKVYTRHLREHTAGCQPQNRA